MFGFNENGEAVLEKKDPGLPPAIQQYKEQLERQLGEAAESLTEELRNWVGEQVGAIAKPDDIRFTDNLPKTRSGKIMRRLLRAIARGEEITQDTSTLENEAILDQLRGLA